MTRTADITAIVNLHSEGMLAYPCLQSVLNAAARADRSGLKVELIAVLDVPDDKTIAYLQEFGSRFQLLQVAHDDLGQARNAGARAATGQWVSFIDGDDIWCENWLVAAHDSAKMSDLPTIFHPFVNIYFGEQQRILVHIDMEAGEFDVLGLAARNYWTSSSFARRELYLSCPYPTVNLRRQVGFEDWSWHLETISRGILHKCVPDTIHAIRTKRHSMARAHKASAALPVRTGLFREILEERSRRSK